jgi:hypothetical protein
LSGGILHDFQSLPKAQARHADIQAMGIEKPTPGMTGRDPVQWQ